MAGSMHDRERCVHTRQTAIEVGGMHPTGMHSCLRNQPPSACLELFF